MNGYKAFYNQKEIEIYANSSYEAQQKAMEVFKIKPKDRYKITVCLCEKQGTQVIHSTNNI